MKNITEIRTNRIVVKCENIKIPVISVSIFNTLYKEY